MALHRRPVPAIVPRPEGLTPLALRLKPIPADQPIPVEEARTAIWLSAGNVTAAAALLGTSSARLGSLVRRSAYLSDERAQAAELAVDRAEKVILDALSCNDTERMDNAARFVLTNAGKVRGWTRDGGGIAIGFAGSAAAAGGAVTIRWQTEVEAGGK